MTEEKSLSGYKSKVAEASNFENPNDGKFPLDDSTEYVFRLVSFPKVITTSQVKENRDGTKTTVKVDKAVCTFEEEQTKNIVNAFFRVDVLNFSEDEAYESAVIRFFKKIKIPLAEGIAPDWTQQFVVGMRFRGRVVLGKDAEKKFNGKYFLDVPTCRPLLDSDKGPAAKPVKPTGSDARSTLANALFLAHGAENYKEAEEKLRAANAPKEVVLALFQANFDGAIRYPIGAK